MSRLKVKISGRVLVKSSASETPLKRSTFLFTLNVSVIFSCFSFDFVDLADFLASAGFLGSTGFFGCVVFLFLPFRVSETQWVPGCDAENRNYKLQAAFPEKSPQQHSFYLTLLFPSIRLLYKSPPCFTLELGACGPIPDSPSSTGSSGDNHRLIFHTIWSGILASP